MTTPSEAQELIEELSDNAVAAQEMSCEDFLLLITDYEIIRHYAMLGVEVEEWKLAAYTGSIAKANKDISTPRKFVVEQANEFCRLQDEIKRLRKALEECLECLQSHDNRDDPSECDICFFSTIGKARTALASSEGSWRDAIGASPSKPGDLPSEHYIRKIRDGEESK